MSKDVFYHPTWPTPPDKKGKKDVFVGGEGIGLSYLPIV